VGGFFCGYILRATLLHSVSMKRVSVRRSAIHGKGVFALCALRAGERIFQYRGLVTTWREAGASLRAS
jgi:SET domain-containing protein